MILIPLSVVLHNNQKEKNKPTSSQKYKHNKWFVQLKVTEINWLQNKRYGQ